MSDMSLTADEKKYFGSLFRAADSEGVGVITGAIAVRFFEKSGLPAHILGQIWEVSDKENVGFLTQQSFSTALRLIGQAQNGREPEASLARQPGPLPKFQGYDLPKPKSSLAPLTPQDKAKYLNTWQNLRLPGDLLDGAQARAIFGKANLPVEQLGQIWALADTNERGTLDVTEFIVAMHLIQQTMNGSLKSIPQQMPAGLLEAARPSTRSQRQQPSTSSIQSVQQQTTGQRQAVPMRSQLTGPNRAGSTMSPQPNVQSPVPEVWDVKPHEKANCDTFFADIDKGKKGYITGDEAVNFFLQSKLDQDDLAAVWDLSDIDNSGTLDPDAFAVAMSLIKLRLAGQPLPTQLPPSLIPPSYRKKTPAFPAQLPVDHQAQPRTIHSPITSAPQAVRSPAPPSADLFSLESPTDDSRSQGALRSFGQPAFVPSSSFGQTIQPQFKPAQISSTGQAPDRDLMAAEPDQVKVSADSTELANLSNQMTSLQTQLSHSTQDRSRLEADNARMKAQKEEITKKLAHIRQIYDQEINTVRSLQNEQATLRAETKELSKEASLIEASLNAISQQHAQINGQLETDRAENINVKDRIKSANEQTAMLQATLEKVRKDAKQQRGLVAINTKQLNTQQAEHERLNREIEAEQQAIEADRISAIEQERQLANLEQSISAKSEAKRAAVPIASAPIATATPIISPQPVSTNPFHRIGSPRAVASPVGDAAFPFVKPAVAAGALAGVGAGAAAVAFGHQGELLHESATPNAHSSTDQIEPSVFSAAEKGKAVARGDLAPSYDDDLSSAYNTAPTTANSITTHRPAELFPTPPIEQSSPQARDMNTLASDAPVNLSTQDKPRPAAISNLVNFSNHSDDGSIGTSIAAQAPASIREIPDESRAMTPTTDLDATQTLESVEPVDVQNTLSHPPTDPIKSVPGAFPQDSPSHDEFEDASPAQEAESSDDEYVEQPGQHFYQRNQPLHIDTQQPSSSSTFTDVGAPREVVAVDEFDDLEEAEEGEEPEESFVSDFSPTYAAPSATNGLATPQIGLPRSQTQQESPARDFSEFAHYSSVLGAPVGLGAPLPESSSTTLKQPPPSAPSRHGTALSPPPAKLNRQISAADDPMLVELMDMGFSREKSLLALERTNYDLGAATDSLLKGH